MKAFTYNFQKVGGDTDISAINGYQQALNEFYRYLARITEFDPNKRMIDAVPILELISQTNAEIAQILQEEQAKEMIGSYPELNPAHEFQLTNKIS